MIAARAVPSKYSVLCEAALGGMTPARIPRSEAVPPFVLAILVGQGRGGEHRLASRYLLCLAAPLVLSHPLLCFPLLLLASFVLTAPTPLSCR